MALATVLSLVINLIVVQGKIEIASEAALRAADSGIHFGVYANAIAKAHYNPWMCNYFREPGYRCVSCSSALHCYPGNFALLIQCAGRNPYCNNGYCSSTKLDKCASADEYDNTSSESGEDTELLDDKIKVDNFNKTAEGISSTSNAADTKKEARRLF